jgi:non-canonical purine NTP pyrophosphatase (RdgB/HAM1 family)
MKLRFVTGNKNKFNEALRVFPELEQLNLELSEIQELDARAIIEHKLREASQTHTGPLFVEDTSVTIEGLNGFPGPLIKWFLQSLGIEGISSLVLKLPNQKATATAWIGYLDHDNTIHFFEGSITGTIVSPRGDARFGWDPIFMPEKSNLTFGEMSLEQKSSISHRKQALEKLKTFIESGDSNQL